MAVVELIWLIVHVGSEDASATLARHAANRNAAMTSTDDAKRVAFMMCRPSAEMRGADGRRTRPRGIPAPPDTNVAHHDVPATRFLVAGGSANSRLPRTALSHHAGSFGGFARRGVSGIECSGLVGCHRRNGELPKKPLNGRMK